MKTPLSSLHLFFAFPHFSPWRLRVLLFVLFCSFLSSGVFAQTKIWDKTFGGTKADRLTSLLATTDGGYLLGGISESGKDGDKSQDINKDNRDFWLVKTDANGNKIWDKNFGESASIYLKTVVNTPDGGYLVGTTANSDEYMALKLDKNGKEVWTKTFSGNRTYSRVNILTCLVAAPGGGYVLGGYTNAMRGRHQTKSTRGGYDYWVIKIDENGNKIWDNRFGWQSNDLLQAIIVTPDGGYLLGGTSESGKGGDKTETSRDSKDEPDFLKGDYWVLKINANGQKQWDKTYGSTQSDKLQSLTVAPNGNFLLGGTSSSGIAGEKTEASRGSWDYWVLNIAADGAKIWDKTLGGTYVDNLSGVVTTPDGGYLLGGASESGKGADKTEPGGEYDRADYWVVKIMADGKKAWDKSFGGHVHDYLTAMIPTADGNYLLGGYSNSNIARDKTEVNRGGCVYLNCTPDYWIVKMKDTGKLEQTITFDPIPERTLNDGSIVLGATASSGLPVSYSIVSGPATLNGNKVTITSAGIVSIKASQAGNATYLAAPDVIRTFTVNNNAPVAKQWDKPFGSQDFANFTSLTATPDKGYLLRYTGGYAGPGNHTREDNVARLDQAGNKLWEVSNTEANFREYSDFCLSLLWKAVVSAPDGGTLIGGTKAQNVETGEEWDDVCITSNYDFYLRKLDTNGQTVWQRTWGSTNDEGITQILVTPDGGYLLGGYSSSGAGGDKTQASRGGTDYWVVKIDGNGHKVWDKTFGGNNNESIIQLIAAADGGYLLGGYSNSDVSGDKTEANRGAQDYWLVKIDNTGNKLWDKTIGTNDATIGENHNYDNSLRALLAADGGVFVVGTSPAGIDGDKTQASRGGLDYWIVKLDANGSKLWDKSLGGNKDDVFGKIITNRDGSYILAGTSFSGVSGDKTEDSRGQADYWVVKLNADGTKIWDKTLGGNQDDSFRDIISADGGYIVAGTSASDISGDKTEASRGGAAEHQDYWVVKLDEIGKKLWDKRYGSFGDDDLHAIIALADNSYVLGGVARFPGGPGGDMSGTEIDEELEYKESVVWLIKIQEKTTAPPVAASWNLRYGGSSTDRFTSVIKTSDGGYLSGGYSNSGVSGDKSQASKGGFDYWIVKTDANGAKLWDKTYGGSSDDFLARIISTKDGGYILAGSSKSGIGGDKTAASRGDQDYWIVKIDGAGIKQWDKAYGGSGFEDFRKVNQLSDGGYLLAGQSNSPLSGDKSQESRGVTDYWVVRISSNGTKLWDQRYGGTNHDYLETFTKTSDGGYLLAGSSASGFSGDKTQGTKGSRDYWLVKIDAQGKKVWDKAYGGSGTDELSSIGYNAAGNYFVAGHSTSGVSGDKTQASKGAGDYWMLLLNRNGEKLWDKSFGGSGTEELRSIIQTKDQGYILAGTSDSNISGDKTQASQGGSDYWIVKTDAQGNKEYDQRYGGSGTEEFRFIQQTQDGGLLLGGRSDSGVSGDRTQPSQGGMDYWLVKVTPVETTILARVAAADIPQEETASSFGLSTYPNPFTEELTVNFTLKQTQSAILKLYDSQGREISTLFRGTVQANIPQRAAWQPKTQHVSGLYLIRLQTSTQVETRKVLLNR